MKEIKTINLTEKFSRNQLYTYLRKENPDLSKNSFKWIIADLQKKGLVYKLASDTYSTQPDMKKQYKPFYSEETSKLIDELGSFYPDVNFVIFETFLLNEFINHQISKNTIVVMVEKEMCEFVFDHINEKYEGKVLLSPDEETMRRYWTENCIIVEKMISEAPLNSEEKHKISLEKLLVDCVTDKVVSVLFTHSEYDFIFEESLERYSVDLKKVKRYAKRRNAWEAVKKFIEEK